MTDDQSLGDAIRKFLSTYHLDDRMKENKLIQSWEKVAGKVVARHTTRLYIRNKILFIRLDSAALKNEIFYMREKIVISLNKEAGAEVIKEIVVQ
ncbi:MAG: DUF721 domain-containing protein [Bacteroidota bacterium]|nr:DUF721 domain-containing protein [Bacteroidota bacterium]